MVIEVICILISWEGIDGVSVCKVVQEIGYIVGILYQNFDNIYDLIFYVNVFSLLELLVELENVSIFICNKFNLVIVIVDVYLEYV